MCYDKSSEAFGLSGHEQRLLRALFEASLEGGPAPGWLLAARNARVRARLCARDLVGEHGRLTLAGLVVAANLPATNAGGNSLAA